MKTVKRNLESYNELITDLETRFNDVLQLHGWRDELKSEAEQSASQRAALLDEAVADTGEAHIDQLAKHSARVEVYAAKLERLTLEIERNEEELQLQFCGVFLPPFQSLHGALMRHRLEGVMDQISALMAPDQVVLIKGLIDQLARYSRGYLEFRGLEMYVPDGVASPLHETFPGSPWGQPEYRSNTVRILLTAIEGAIPKAKRLLAAIESEKDFLVPEIESAAPSVPVVETQELVEA